MERKIQVSKYGGAILPQVAAKVYNLLSNSTHSVHSNPRAVIYHHYSGLDSDSQAKFGYFLGVVWQLLAGALPIGWRPAAQNL